MKRVVCLIIIALVTLGTEAAERKKVGLVLGGGGAKGVAHIGVIKVLEEAEIPIDYIVGTSMGAIVGGLYSIGYSTDEIDSMVLAQDWKTLLSDRVARNSQSFPEKETSERYLLSLPFGKTKKDVRIDGMIKGQNLMNLFSNLTIGYHDATDFNNFQIPFASVAVNVVDGEEYVFRNGSLPLAMRASMAIPAVFAPVRLDSMVLIDGGFTNNYPADVALSMGADIIIGVDLGTSDLKELEDINSTGDLIGQIVAIYGHDKYNENKKGTNLLFRPNMEPFNSASFSIQALDTLIRRGEQDARHRWDEIIALKKEIGIDDTFKPKHHDAYKYVSADEHFFIRSISLEGIEPKDEDWLIKVTKLKPNSYVTVTQLQNAISILLGTESYTDAGYKLTGEDGQDLVLTVKKKAVSSANLGLRFDSEEMVSVLLNLTLGYHKRYHSKFAFTGRVGKSSYARLDYSIERIPLRNLNFAYQISYKDLDVYDRGEKDYSYTYMHHLAEVGYTDMNWLNFKFQIGGRFNYFDYNSFLVSENNQIRQVVPEAFISYFALAHFETFDRRYYPNKGVSLKAEYSLHTDNFVGYDGGLPLGDLSASFSGVIPTSSRFSIIPSLYGRVLIGNEVPFPLRNIIGGETPERYVPQQLSFAGINRMEMFDNSVVISRIQLRHRIMSNHYVTLTSNYGMHCDDFFTLSDGERFWGVGLGYGYNSLAGPLNANLGFSNRSDKPQFYLNLGYSF